ncbi:MAG: undecaprenyl-phosphate galactose phosphotransferase [Devosia sp.]|nr:undecaprenyl-phosphate galactose phosphotransferase [Devosia sp.]
MFDSFVGKPVEPGVGTAPRKRRQVLATRLYQPTKRVLDLGLVLLFGPLFVPLILMLALLVRLDGGPSFYRQPRLGRHGRVFRLVKLRTMVVDADAALARHLESDPAAKAEWGATQKLRRDPRLTPLGGFLRRYSLDELPQLWNVLVGDMSLVGPRPMLPQQRPLYRGTAYFDMLPGLTGLWQISERNDCSFAARADYDTRYAQIASLGTDFRILWRTIDVVFRGTGC